jgi:hypothetical protein
MRVIVDTLRTLLAGDPIERGRLLPVCTAEAFGVEASGEIAIRELFARNRAPLSPSPHLVSTDRHLALFDTDPCGREQALFIETYHQRITRLWRLGQGVADVLVEPRLRVAIDPFLQQSRETIAFDAEDFPDVDSAAVPAIAGALAEVVGGSLGAADTADRRVIALRAFSAGTLAAVLAQLVGPRASPVLFAAALWLDGGSCVRTWHVADQPRTDLILDDLTMGNAALCKLKEDA